MLKDSYFQKFIVYIQLTHWKILERCKIADKSYEKLNILDSWFGSVKWVVTLVDVKIS